MTKIKELQAQVTALQSQLTRANQERDTWKRIADTRNSTLTHLYTQMDNQDASYKKKLADITQAMANKGAEIVADIQHRADLDFVRAQRDTLGQAFKYLADKVSE